MNGGLLENGDGRWTSCHHWTLPSTNATGIIRNADTGKVLGIVDIVNITKGEIVQKKW